MINVWDYQDVEGKVKLTCTDGQVFVGNMGEITDVGEESEDYGFGEDSLTIYSDRRAIVFPQSEIKSIEILG